MGNNVSLGIKKQAFSNEKLLVIHSASYPWGLLKAGGLHW